MFYYDSSLNKYITSDGNSFYNLYLALKWELGYWDVDLETHMIRYEWKTNDKICAHKFFHELAKDIYKFPDAIIIRVEPELTEEQKEFLEKVRELGKEAKIMDALMR